MKMKLYLLISDWRIDELSKLGLRLGGRGISDVSMEVRQMGIGTPFTTDICMLPALINPGSWYIRKAPKGFPKKPTQTRRTSQWVHKSEALFQGKFQTEKAGVMELPFSITVGNFQLPVRPWCGADEGCVYLTLSQWFCRKLQKSLAEWLRKEGMRLHRVLVVSLSGPNAL